MATQMKKICKRRKHRKIHKEFLGKSQILDIEYPFLTKKKQEKEIQKKELPPDEQRCCKTNGMSWRCKNVRMWVDAEEDATDVPNTKYCRQHYFYHVSWRKKNRSEGASGSKRNFTCDSDKIIQGGSHNIETKRKSIGRSECSGELESLSRTRDHVVELESLEHYKSECAKLAVELEKKKVECATLQGKFAEADTRMTAVTDESKRTLVDATECWRKMLSDLDSRVLMMENENSTRGCLESRISNLESIVQRMDNENKTVVGCVESRILKLESLYLKIEDEDLTRAGCVESRLLNLESLVRRSKKPFVHVVSDDSSESSGEPVKEDCNNSVDSKKSFGVLMYKLAMNNWNRSRDKEIKWKSEANMLSSFEEDPELCMKALCALYRQKISEDKISAKGLFHYRDVIRVTTLAEFLMDGDCKGDLKKSVEELEIFDSEAVGDCKRLARSYSKQLFSIYQNRKDLYFLPTITDIHGDQTAK